MITPECNYLTASASQFFQQNPGRKSCVHDPRSYTNSEQVKMNTSSADYRCVPSYPNSYQHDQRYYQTSALSRQSTLDNKTVTNYNARLSRRSKPVPLHASNGTVQSNMNIANDTLSQIIQRMSSENLPEHELITMLSSIISDHTGQEYSSTSTLDMHQSSNLSDPIKCSVPNLRMTDPLYTSIPEYDMLATSRPQYEFDPITSSFPSTVATTPNDLSRANSSEKIQTNDTIDFPTRVSNSRRNSIRINESMKRGQLMRMWSSEIPGPTLTESPRTNEDTDNNRDSKRFAEDQTADNDTHERDGKTNNIHSYDVNRWSASQAEMVPEFIPSNSYNQAHLLQTPKQYTVSSTRPQIAECPNMGDHFEEASLGSKEVCVFNDAQAITMLQRNVARMETAIDTMRSNQEVLLHTIERLIQTSTLEDVDLSAFAKLHPTPTRDRNFIEDGQYPMSHPSSYPSAMNIFAPSNRNMISPSSSISGPDNSQAHMTDYVHSQGIALYHQNIANKGQRNFHDAYQQPMRDCSSPSNQQNPLSDVDKRKKEIQSLEAAENNKVVIHVKTDSFSDNDVKCEMNDRCPGIVDHVIDVNVYDKSKTLILTYTDARSAQHASQALQAHLRKVAHSGQTPSKLIKSVGISKPPIIRDLRAYSQKIKEKYSDLPIVVYAEMPVIGKVFPEGRRTLHAYRLEWAAEANLLAGGSGEGSIPAFMSRPDSVIVFLSKGPGGVFECKLSEFAEKNIERQLRESEQWPQH